MYTYNSRVRFSQTDVDAKMRLTSIIDEFQDASIMQSEDINIGRNSIKKLGVGWVLAAWQIDVLRYPDYEEPLVVGTMPYGFFGVMGMRNFFLKDGTGNYCAVANSVWGMIDTNTLTPARIPKEILAAYELDDKLDMEYLPRKIEVTGFAQELLPVTIMQRHLDLNKHTNNGKYVEIALECMDFESDVKRMRAEFKKPALLGNKLYPILYKNDASTIAELRHEAGDIAAIVEIFK